MRPYLAVIRDSFHEALVSRVLWILLALSTLLLLSLLPLGIVEQAGSVLQHDDFLDPPRLIDKVVAHGQASAPSPGHRIWELLEPSTREALRAAPAADKPFEVRRRERLLETSLQDLIKRRDFYRAEDWEKVVLPASARELRERGVDKLADDELARFNRLALEAAYPDEIAPSTNRQVQLAYFRWELGLPLPVEREQLFPAINQLVAFALGTLLGVAGVFVAVLVTASMIPQAFEAGSVDLLLSKPISRSLLFLSKFVGGCAFIAINAAYLIGGLWLVLGLKFDLWNPRLLWAIPLYLFLFAIYYGVSALAGVVWRNAIVSVVMAIVFWFVCWTLGTANGLVEALALTPRKLQTLVPAGGTTIAANSSTVYRWDAAAGDWQAIFAPKGDNPMPFMFLRQLVGPVYDATGQRILAFRAPMPGFGGMRGANPLLIGKQSDDWRRTEGVTVPEGAAELFVAPGGDVLVAGAQGIYRLEGDLMAKQKDINFFGVHVPLPERGGRFANIGPKLQLRPLVSAAMDPATSDMALFDGLKLVRFTRQTDGKYQQAAQHVFETKREGKLGLASDRLFLATDTGEILLFERDLKPGSPESLPGSAESAAESAATSADGKYLAVVWRDGRLTLLDAKQATEVAMPLVGQGNISAVAFQDQDMLAVDRLTRVTRYDLAKRTRGAQLDPPMSVAEQVYRYALHPLYTVFPKPGQLNETVSYVLTPKDTTPGAISLQDRNAPQPKVDVWGPIWSNLVFLVVVLAVSCAYVSRKDF